MARYAVIVWDNDGMRSEHDAADVSFALRLAKSYRTPENRTVKVGHIGNAIYHWTRTNGATGNHWSARATADEFFA